MQGRRVADVARTGRRRPKGAATKAPQDARAPKMLLRYEVEATAPALTDRRLCQMAAYTVSLPDLGAKDPAQKQKRLCQHLAAALPR